MLIRWLNRIRLAHWKRRYRPGKLITSFLAPDIRREVEVIDTSLIDSGVIAVRTRTWNILYEYRGIQPKPPFGEVRNVRIAELWNWSGAMWGGPVPESEDRSA